MAITRKLLEAMGIEAEKIDQIIEEHLKTVNEIKEERDKMKAQLADSKTLETELSGLKSENEKLKKDLENAEETKQKYKDLRTEFDDYKADIEKKDNHVKKADAYKDLLLKAGISEKRIASILKVSDVDSVELDTEGNVKDAEKLTETIKSEWADFIQTTESKGANTPTPPNNQGGSTFEKMSLVEKMSYANENPDATEVKAWLGEK